MAVLACPEPDNWQKLAAGELPAEEVERLADHLEQCAPCAEQLETLKGQDTLVEMIRRGGATGLQDAGERVQDLIRQLRDMRTRFGALAKLTPGEEAVAIAEYGAERTIAAETEYASLLAPAQAPDELGRLGTYRILKVLGVGGMGVVFEAEDMVLRRPIALKAMKPGLGASPSCRQRFLREAQSAAAVRHDHIVTIYQAGEHEGIAYLAMELLHGESLEDRLQRQQKLPVADVLDLGRQIALGLAAAHERGLIHRDIKPGNIWLESVVRGQWSVAKKEGELAATDYRPVTADSRVKLLDFGLARAAEGEGQITTSGAVIGTPAYMAPEQANGEAVDARADLFSLGAVLYRMVTGAMPFRGARPLQILHAVTVDQPPPPCELDPSLPRGVSDLIMRLLAKDPQARPESASAVVQAIHTLENDIARRAAALSRRDERRG